MAFERLKNLLGIRKFESPIKRVDSEEINAAVDEAKAVIKDVSDGIVTEMLNNRKRNKKKK